MNWLKSVVNAIFGPDEEDALETTLLVPCRTPLRYAFYGVQEDGVAETAAFVNLIHIGAWGDWVTVQGRAALLDTIIVFAQQAKAHGRKIMLTCDWCLFTQTSPRQNLPRDNAVGYMIEFCNRLQADGLIDIIDAWYTIDEPNISEIGLNATQIADANSVIRDVTQHYTDGIKPLAVIYGQSNGHYPGIETYDWCGFDNYDSPIFSNGQYNHLVSQLGPNQKTIIVPGGGNPWQEDPIPFYNHAQTDIRVIMIMPFKWFDPDGIRSNGMAATYQHVGNMIVATNPFPIEPEPPDVVRFPAQLPYDKWAKVNGVFTFMRDNQWAAAEAYFKDPANTADITDSIGAGDYWRQQYQP